MLEPGLGIHISLMDTSEYSVIDPNAQLAPEDLALLDVSLSVLYLTQAWPQSEFDAGLCIGRKEIERCSVLIPSGMLYQYPSILYQSERVRHCRQHSGAFCTA